MDVWHCSYIHIRWIESVELYAQFEQVYKHGQVPQVGGSLNGFHVDVVSSLAER